MDAVHETISAHGVALRGKPSDRFRRQCFISGDPDETEAPHIVAPLAPDARRKMLGDDVRPIDAT